MKLRKLLEELGKRPAELAVKIDEYTYDQGTRLEVTMALFLVLENKVDSMPQPLRAEFAAMVVRSMRKGQS